MMRRSGTKLLARGAAPIVIVIGLLLTPAHAVEPDEILKDAALEARARQISTQLRCLVCQNQSIDDSHAPLARDLRLLVRERLVAGDSDEGVKRFLVQRYGEFVLLKPPLGLSTLLLWLTPLLVLAGAGLLLTPRIMRPSSPPASAEKAADAPLSPDEEARLAELLKDPGSGPAGGSRQSQSR